MNYTLYIAAAVLTGLFSAGRLTRLFAQDAWPPAVSLRVWWDRVTKDGEWSLLAHCHWCLAPYVTAVVMASALLSNLHMVWWIVNGWLAASYVVSMIVEHDDRA